MSEDNLIGKQLDEYRLEALLGQGGMARVYRGIDVRLKRYVAIKVIDAPYQADPNYAFRFEREAQAIAQLDHPHIVRLYRYGEAAGLLYMAMQYIDGANLEDVLTTYRADHELIEPADAQRIIREVCLALDYAHSRGVIHRDVKPANIILDQQGRAILTDFGLALLIDLGTRGEIFGSPHYLAPEQAISSAGAGPQSDLYSIGVILYEMFTGQVPFDAELPLDIARMHMIDPPPPPREVRPALGPELEEVILKTLAKEPTARYASGAALADALDRALQAKPVAPALPTSPRFTIPQRVAVEQARYPLPPLPAMMEAATPLPHTPYSEPALSSAINVVPPRSSGKLSRLERMIGLGGVSPSRRMLYRIFIGIILLSGLFYCIGLAALAMAPASKNSLAMATPAATFGPGAQSTTVVAGLIPSPSLTPTLTPNSLPSATGTSTLTLMPTHTAASTAVPTFTFTPSATYTPFPSLTPVPTATPISAPLSYTLLIAKRGDDSLFVVNETALAFPLVQLRLGDRRGAIDGAEWGIDMLENGACVTAWKDSGKPKPPGKVTCTQVGTRLIRDGSGRFWKDAFNVYYSEELIGVCRSERCSFNVAVQP